MSQSHSTQAPTTAPAASTTAAIPPAPPASSRHRPKLGLVAIVCALTTAVALMMLAFVTPAINSGAKNLPIAVAGPAPVVQQISGALDQRQPGAFEVTTVAAAEEIDARIREREVVGGISVGTDGVTIHTASAAGTPYANVLRGVGAGLSASGQKVTYTDVVPLTGNDPAGTGLTALGLPLVFGGMASAALLSIVMGGTASRRVAGAVTIAVAAGLVATAILQFGFGAIDGNYLLTSAAVAMGIAAISLTVLGLESLLGLAGLGLGAVIMLFVANPLSGMATGPQWLPQGWGAFGQYLPLGAAGTAIRSAAFFDGHGMTTALIVLGTWCLVGAALTYLARRPTAPHSVA